MGVHPRLLLYVLLTGLVGFWPTAAQKTDCSKASVADIVFLIDGSWSIGNINFQQMRSFLYTLVEGLDVAPDKVRVGMAQYSGDARTEFLMNTYADKASLLNYLKTLPYKGGNTKTGLGIEFLMQNHLTDAAGSRKAQNVPQVVIIITDGKSQDDVAGPAEKMRNMGASVYAIGIKDADISELGQMASSPASKFVYNVDDFSALAGISEQILQTVCVTVEEIATQLVINTQTKYADIVFLVDGSDKVGGKNFAEFRNFIFKFVDSLDVGEDKIRIGIAQYSDDSEDGFLLKSHSTKKQVIKAIKKIQFKGGDPYTGNGLQQLLESQFTAEAGSRKDLGYPQVAILLTGSLSEDEVEQSGKELRHSGVRVYAVGVDQADATELEQVGSEPAEEHVFYVSNYGGLDGLQSRMSLSLAALLGSATAEEDGGACSKASVADIVFLIDGSWSIGNINFQQMRSFLYTLVEGLDVAPDKVRVGMAQYSGDARTEFLMNTFADKASLLNYLKTLPYKGGNTKTGLGIEFLMQNHLTEAAGSRRAQNVPQVVIIITDGKSQDDVAGPAVKMRNMGASVYAIGIKDADISELGQMASSPASKFVYNVDDFSALAGISEQILQTVCVTVEEIVTEIRKPKFADIVFIMDGSDNVGKAGFEDMRKVVYKIASILDVAPDQNRIGVVQYNDNGHAEFLLNTHSSKEDVLKNIRQFKFRGGIANTGAGIRFAEERLFTEQAGSRKAEGFAQIAVLLTGSASQDEVERRAKALKDSGVTVFALGANKANLNELNLIGSDPSANFVFYQRNFRGFLSSLARILQSLLGLIQINIEVIEGERYADIVFLLDDTDNVGSANFEELRKLVIMLIEGLNVGKDKVRIGMAQYGRQPSTTFFLNAHGTKEEVAAGVRSAVFRGGPRANTGSGMRFLQENHFVEQAGSRVRQGFPQIAVLLTGSASQDNASMGAEAIKGAGGTVFAIGANRARLAELNRVASSPPDNHAFYVNNFGDLSGLYTQLMGGFNTLLRRDEEEEEVEKPYADVVFLLDSSDAVGRKNFEGMKTFVGQIVEYLDVDASKVRVGLAQYSDNPRNEFFLNTHGTKPDVQAAIQLARFTGGRGANTGEAVRSLLQNHFTAQAGSRKDEGYTQIAVILTGSDSQDVVEQHAVALKQEGVKVFALGAEQARLPQLNALGSLPSEQHVLYAPNFSELFSSFDRFLKYLRLKIHTGILAGEGYADVVFLVDGSDAVGQENFRHSLGLVSRVVDALDVDKDHIRIGLAQYSGDPRAEFFLSTHAAKKDVTDAIRGIRFKGGRSGNMGAALQHLKDNHFVEAAGSRVKEGFPQIAVLVAGSGSGDDVLASAQALKNDGTTVFAIGAGAAKLGELVTAGSDPEKDYVFYQRDFRALSGLSGQLAEGLSSLMKQESEEQCTKVDKADIVLLVDGSWSIGLANFQQMREFLYSIVDGLTVGKDQVRIGMAQFSGDPRTEFFLKTFSSQKDILDYIKTLPYKGGNTMTGRALEFISDNHFTAAAGSRKAQNVPQIAVVITDGKSQDDVEDAAEKLRKLGIAVYAIGIKNADFHELQQIASQPSSKFTYNVVDFSLLRGIVVDIIQTVCFTADEIQTNAFNPEDSVIDIDSLKTKFADVVFLLDGSTGIRAVFDEVRNVATNIVDKLDVSQDRVRIGVAQYGGAPRSEFVLRTHDNKEAVLAGIRSTNAKGGAPNLGQGIRFLMENQFVERAGSRAKLGYPQIAVIISGSASTDEIQQRASVLRKSGVKVYAVGAERSKPEELVQLTGGDARLTVSMDRFSEFTSRLPKVLKRINNLVDKDLALQLMGFALGCQHVPKADVLYIIDGSSNMDELNFERARRFLFTMVAGFPVSADDVRVALVQLGGEPAVEFRLDTHATKSDALDAVRALQLRGGAPRLGAAIDLLRNTLLLANAGGRSPTIPQVVVILLAGKPDDDVRRAVTALRNTKAMVYAIGMHNAVDDDLRVIASDPKQHHTFRLDGPLSFPSMVRRLSEVVCAEIESQVPQVYRADSSMSFFLRGRPLFTNCRMQRADIVFLVDTSYSVGPTELEMAKAFMYSLVKRFDVGRDYVHFGLAQYNVISDMEFSLTQHLDKDALLNAITAFSRKDNGDTTNIGLALSTAADNFFRRQVGSRIDQGVRQYMLVITDGESFDDITLGAKKLHALNVSVMAIGVQAETTLQRTGLSQIAKPSDFIRLVSDFHELPKIEEEITKDICPEEEAPTDAPLTTPPPLPPTTGDCNLDVLIGFDVTQLRGGDVFISQRLLENQLRTILARIAFTDVLSCTGRANPVVRLGFLAPGARQPAFQLPLQAYSKTLVDSLGPMRTAGPFQFTEQSLIMFLNKFQKEAYPKAAKVVILFTDGVDQEIEKIQRSSEKLRLGGVNALITVALEGTKQPENLFLLEFGRGFRFQHMNTVNQPDLDSQLVKDLDNVLEWQCCGVHCKCSGQSGRRGQQGSRGQKGDVGPSGISGHPGEEGGMGERGPSGLNGTHGFQGCPGLRGQKGSRGLSGRLGEDGEHALDGISGKHGEAGRPGVAGPKGLHGRQGGRGIQGEPGERGSLGIQGDPGEQGIRSQVAGPPGDRGQQGIEGDVGRDGDAGGRGEPGAPGSGDRRGPKGPQGEKGIVGLPGPTGASGSPGTAGNNGPGGKPGIRGEAGIRGLRGEPGPAGPKGDTGRAGTRGRKGESGIVGDKGLPGPAGPRGETGIEGLDGIGVPGVNGSKGDPGLMGYPGLRGIDGSDGENGTKGSKGMRGQRGYSGQPGATGSAGEPGPAGEEGPRGRDGTIPNVCKLVNTIREKCTCCQGKISLYTHADIVFTEYLKKHISHELLTCTASCTFALFEAFRLIANHLPPHCTTRAPALGLPPPHPRVCAGKQECPAYPTELVIALDVAQGASAVTLSRMKAIVKRTLQGLTLARSNGCPQGARVALLTYDGVATTTRFRFAEPRGREDAIARTDNVTFAASGGGGRRDTGRAMQYVARNAFKRVRQGQLLRKVAVFITNGPSQNADAVSLGAAQLVANDITTLVLSFERLPHMTQALKIDSTKLSRVVVLPAAQATQEAALESALKCTVCFDQCNPDAQCAVTPGNVPVELAADVAFLVDGSMDVAQFAVVQRLVKRAIEQISVTSAPHGSAQSRLSLLQYSPFGARATGAATESAVKVEFGFTQFGRDELLEHVQQKLQPLSSGSTTVAGPAEALQWVTRNAFRNATLPRKKRAVVLLTSGQGMDVSLREEAVRNMEVATGAMCQGLALFVVGLGPGARLVPISVFASPPAEIHQVTVSTAGGSEEAFLQHLLHTFFSILSQDIFEYPPKAMSAECARLKKGRAGTPQGDETDRGDIAEIMRETASYGHVQSDAASANNVHLAESAAEQASEPQHSQAHSALDSGVEESQEQRSFILTPPIVESAIGGTSEEGLPELYSEGDSQGMEEGDADAEVHLTSPSKSAQPEEPAGNKCMGGYDTGTVCSKFQAFWYFNNDTGGCGQFWYGGCDGNANRFPTEEECVRTCLSPSKVEKPAVKSREVCKLPLNEGTCQNFALKWHHDGTERRCIQFWYSGCGGNANRFDTEAECARTCHQPDVRKKVLKLEQ
ncbi:collagen alpha-3(VI) chain isoform X4 [Petromyzon marinus]